MGYFGLDTPVTLASFMMNCLLSLAGGIVLAAVMLVGASLYFKLFKHKVS